MDSVIYFKWVLFLLFSSQLTYLDMNCFGGSSSSVSLGFRSLAELLLIYFSHEWFQDLSEMWVYRIWEGLLCFIFFFASSILLCDCDFSNSGFLISTLACLHVLPTAIGLRLKAMKMRIHFIQCSYQTQFLQVADFGFMSTFYSCFMRENYSGRILFNSYLKWISIVFFFFFPEVIIKMFLLCWGT